MRGSRDTSGIVRLRDVDGAVVDLDGVVTDTARLHAAAWAELFDGVVAEHPGVAPFDVDRDYLELIDGRPRNDGVANFLTSRGIVLPWGAPDDDPSAPTVCGLARRKDDLFRKRLAGGIRSFPGTTSFLRGLRAAGKRVALVTASRNASAVLAAARVADLFDVVVDGVVAADEHLPGKPDPSTFLRAAALLGLAPDRAIVVEDALAGVDAGRRGGFGVVVGVDRHGEPEGLLAAGADLVVADLADLATVPVLADPRWTLALDDGPADGAGRTIDALLALGDGWVGVRGDLDGDRPGRAWLSLVSGAYGANPPGDLVHLLPGPSLRPLGAGSSAGVTRWVLQLRDGVVHHEPAAPEPGWSSTRFASIVRPGAVGARRAGEVAALGSPLTCPPSDRGLSAAHTYDEGVLPDGRTWAVTVSDRATVAAVAADRSGRDVRDRIVVFRGGGAGHAPELRAAAADAVDELSAVGFDAALAEHRQAWRERWDALDIEIVGDEPSQLAIRFALFHLLSCAATEGEAAVGARGLTGLSYSGHVFWDTDVFVLPVLAATLPEAARAVLEYRLRRLPAARRRAAEHGHEGARFPWESADDGEDVTPTTSVGFDGVTVPVLTGELEEHVTADVAWAADRYARWTGDDAFLTGPGRDLVTETARYWASRVRVDAEGQAHLDGVIGPDEYHEDVDDSAFTNVLARWNLRRGAALVEHDHPEEAAAWRGVADRLVDGWDPVRRCHEQFAGYWDLEPLRIAELSPLPVAADVLLGRERTARAQVLKQPDVLMLHHLLPEELPPGSLAGELEHYLPRISHGSSLSPAICASLLARAGRPEEAMPLFDLAARLDLDDLTDRTGAGLHLATFGGLWQAVVHGFAGVSADGDGLRLDPQLPSRWTTVRVGLRFRGRVVQLVVGHDEVSVSATAPLRVRAGTCETTTPARLARGPDGWRSA